MWLRSHCIHEQLKNFMFGGGFLCLTLPKHSCPILCLVGYEIRNAINMPALVDNSGAACCHFHITREHIPMITLMIISSLWH